MQGFKNIKNEMKNNQVKINLRDKTLFGNEAGEDEDIEILNSYFLEKTIFDDFYENSTKLAVVSGRKGMGKSALLSKLEYILKDDEKYNNPIVIRTTGTELLGLGNFQNMNEIQLENYWKQIICKKINLEIGKTLNFAFSDDAMTLVESAEIDNMKSENIISSLITRLGSKVPLTNLERDKKVPSDWKALLTRYQENHNNSNVWILVDDIDAKFQNNKEYQNIVSSFFSALRSLIKINNLNIRASVRTDVWNSLTHIEDLDKWEQYITEIIWTRNEMKEILAKRILAYLNKKTS
jgi:energy-coupling factor transporter ATP-binding protein EcfA2